MSRRTGSTRVERKPRSLAAALADFDATPEQVIVPEQIVADDPSHPFLLPPERGGKFARGTGWSPVPDLPRVEVYRNTTDQVGGLFPFISARQLPAEGPVMGIDADSGAGLYVPIPLWLRMGLVSNTNVLIYGKPGMGKSFIVKSYISRCMTHGMQVFIAGDMKDEYTPLCKAYGYDPMMVGPGLSWRLNPLDQGPLALGWEGLSDTEKLTRFNQIRSRWLVLLEALIDVGGARVEPSTSQAIAHVLDRLTGMDIGTDRGLPTITIPDVWRAMEDPDDELVSLTRFRDRGEFLDAMRQPTDALGKMVGGVLKGMFDGPTNMNTAWDAPIQSVSLRSLKPLGDEAIAVAMTCVNSWSHTLGDMSKDAPYRVMVRDEVWRVMRLGDASVKSLDSDLRLGRDQREIQILAAHKPSDMGAVGDANSQAARLAGQIGSLCDTKILLAQEAEVAEELKDQLDLSDLETGAIQSWCWKGVGRSLWKIGDQTKRVIGLSTPTEKELFETNTEEAA